MKNIPLLFVLGAVALPVHAEVFKCTVDAKTVYQDHPCDMVTYRSGAPQTVQRPHVVSVTNTVPAVVPTVLPSVVPHPTVSPIGKGINEAVYSIIYKIFLPLILFLLGLSALLFFFKMWLAKVGIRHLKNKTKSGLWEILTSPQVNKKSRIDWFDRDRPFTRKKRLLSPSEAVMLEKLRLVFPAKQFEVFPCVRLADLIEIDLPEWQTNNRARELNDIARMHVDFVICRKTSSEIVAAVELDDPSHDKLKAITRDKRKDLALNAAGVRLYRFRVEDDNHYQQMKQEILGMQPFPA